MFPEGYEHGFAYWRGTLGTLPNRLPGRAAGW